MFILDFLCIHPFHDGIGRMSRLLTLLLLYREGYMVGKYISIEKLIEESKKLIIKHCMKVPGHGMRKKMIMYHLYVIYWGL